VALDDFEKERVRYHLGYLNVSTAASLQFGLPRPIQTLFIIELAMEQLPEVALPRVRRLLKILDNTECRLENAQSRLAAASLGELKIERQGMQEPDLLEHEYWRWASRLADQLGVPLYAYSNRFKGQGPASGNIPVRG
jgi:hypothetical protein